MSRSAHPSRRSAALLGGLVLATALLITAAAPVTAVPSTPVQLTLPAPTGPHRVGTVSLHLVDPSRPDPWVPARTARELMIQMWYPAAAISGHPKAPWLTPATVRGYEQSNGLPAGVLSWPTTHAHLGAPVDQRRGGRPVIVYSHGLGGERTETTALIEDLASHGYIVVTIDHIHDARVVELPDGRLEFNALPEMTDDNEVQLTTKAINARVVDARFVLDQLAALDRGKNIDAETRPLPRGLRGALDLAHVGIMGHSDGGATAAAVTHVDSRITAGINLDGTFWTADSAAGSRHPFLLVGRQGQTRDTNPTWAAFWADQRGPKLQLNLTGSTHATFEDVAVLIPQAASAIGLTPEQVVQGLGTIDGERAVTVLRAYVNAYFDRYLRHRHSHLLAGPSAEYPEMKFNP